MHTAEYKNGILSFMTDGLKHGVEYEFNEDSSIKKITRYFNGKKHGLCQEYEDLLAEYTYNDDVIQGKYYILPKW